jgi:hypothetical protein
MLRVPIALLKQCQDICSISGNGAIPGRLTVSVPDTGIRAPLEEHLDNLAMALRCSDV